MNAIRKTARTRILSRAPAIVVLLSLLFSLFLPTNSIVRAQGEAPPEAQETIIPTATEIPPNTPPVPSTAFWRNELAGYEFEYPKSWTATEPATTPGGTTLVVFTTAEGTLINFVEQAWQPADDLNAYLAMRSALWSDSGMVITAQENLILSADRPAVRLTLQDSAGVSLYLFLTSIGSQYLEFNSADAAAPLAQIMASLHQINPTPTETPVPPTPVPPTPVPPTPVPPTPVPPTKVPPTPIPPTPTPQKTEWSLPILQSSLSADGMTVFNAVPPLVVVADKDPAHQGIQVPAEPNVQAAIAAVAEDPELINAAFSITYKAAGTTDPWGAVCQTFPTNAKTAFNAAAAIWTATLQSSVPISIHACWSNLGSSTTLGYSGGGPSHRDFSGAPRAGTWYMGALANALHGSDLSTNPDAYITYNSNFTWYYGTDGHPTTGTYDLVTVATHEIAHALNFAGTANKSGTLGYWGSSGYPNIYDTFMENSAGTRLITFTSGSTALGTLLTSGSLWFDGTNANAANGGTRVKMYAPSTWAPGSSYSHLDYSTFAGTSNSMMVYAVSPASAQHNPGNVTKGLLKDLGWVMAATTVGTPTPQSPSGATADTTPTFTWTKVSGATQYQFAVYQGATLRYTQTVLSTSCGSSATTCSFTPTTALSLAAHSWKVRAYKGGIWSAYSALKSFTVTQIPTPSAPSGTTTDTTPTFTWTKIAGVTQYQFAVYQGATLKYTKTVASSACGSSATICSNTPTNVLAYAAHSWKVRAYYGGVWKSYSALKSFTVVSAAFDSQFTTNATGWTPVNGSWSVASGYYQSPGLANNFISSRHAYTYNIFTYETKMQRTGCATCSYGILFNGTPTPLGSGGRWNKGYGIYISDNRQYSIWSYTGGVATAIRNWTSHSAITTGWNTLKVTYNSSTKYMRLYINGILVGTGTFTTYTSGAVGLVIYNDTSSGNRLYVDYAKLSLTAPSAIVAGESALTGEMIFSDAMPDMQAPAEGSDTESP